MSGDAITVSGMFLYFDAFSKDESDTIAVTSNNAGSE